MSAGKQLVSGEEHMLPVLPALAILANAGSADLRSLTNWSLMELEVVAVNVQARRLTVRHHLIAPTPWTLPVAARAADELRSLVPGSRVRVLCRTEAEQQKGSPPGRPSCAEVLDLAVPPRWPEGPFRNRRVMPVSMRAQVVQVPPGGQALVVRAVAEAAEAPGKEWVVALRGWAKDDAQAIHAGDQVRLTCVTDEQLMGEPPEVACLRASAIHRLPSPP
jgi:hypothetical protein